MPASQPSPHPHLRPYEPGIDGLRAVAVLAVVMFHVAPQLVPGGFIGVDVFFVVSGFLISRNIVDDLRAGTFSLTGFYARRARRILPALIVTIAVSMVVAVTLLTPGHLQQTAGAAVYSLLSIGNIFFWREAGYFDSAAEFKPLLHLWTLGVEEQFYVLWPALLVLGFRSRRFLLGALLLSGALSLGASTWRVASEPAAAFYLTPFRMWEFVIGAVCVWTVTRRAATGWMNAAVLGAGLAAIVTSALLYSRETLFPGFAALLPCVGAAMCLHATDAPVIGRLLTNRLAVGIGLISYSLYLVHWPFYVFYKYFVFRPLVILEQCAIVAASIVAATLLYRLVEQPFRRQRLPYGMSGRVVLAFASALILSTGVVAYRAWAERGWPWRLDGQAQLYWRQMQRDDAAMCARPPEMVDRVYVCPLGAVSESQAFDVALLGDSHAFQWLPGLNTLFRQHEILGANLNFGAGGFLPLVGAMTYDNSVPRAEVPAVARDTEDLLLKTGPPVVIWSARWSFYAWTRREPGEDGERKFLTYRPFTEQSPSSSLSALRLALTDTLSRYRAAGLHTILLGQVPYPGATASDCLTRPGWLWLPRSGVECQQTSAAEVRERLASTDALLMEFQVRNPADVTTVLFSDLMCAGHARCDFLDEDGAYYTSNGHLSAYGSKVLANKYLTQIVPLIQRKVAARRNLH